jgi:RNA polymerase sigma-70 factor (sigma-E family)
MRTRTRDEQFKDFFEMESARLERFATMLVGDPFEGAELTQEAMARVYARWARVKDGSPSSYARQIVVNLVRSAHRSKKLRALKPVPGWARGDRELEAPDARVGDEVRIVDALDHLSPIRRATVLLRFYEDMSEHEIANLLDRPVGTVKADIHRALRQLRPLLEEANTGERRR